MSVVLRSTWGSSAFALGTVIDTLDVSPDERWVLVAGPYVPPRLFELTTGDLVRSFGETDLERTMILSAFRPRGGEIVFASSSGRIDVVEVASGSTLRTWQGLARGAFRAAMSPNGRFVLSAGTDGACLDDLETQTRTELPGLSDVRSVCFSPDGKHALFGCRHGRVTHYDLDTHTVLREWDANLGDVDAIAISLDAPAALSGAHARRFALTAATDVVVTNLDSGEVHGITIEDDFRCLALSPDSTRFVAGLAKSALVVGTIATGKTVTLPEPSAGPFTILRFLGDGRRLLSGSQDGRVRLWDLDAGIRLSPQHDSASITALCVTSDSARVLVGDHEGRVAIRRASDGALERIVEALRDTWVHTLFPAGGAAAWHDEMVPFDPETGALGPLVTLPRDEGVRVWSSDARLRVAAGHEWREDEEEGPEQIVLRDVSSERFLWTLTLDEEVGAIALGRLHVVAGFSDGVLRVYENSDGRESSRHDWHHAAIQSVAIGETGRAFSVDADGVAFFWPIPGGAPAIPLAERPLRPREAIFGPDDLVLGTRSDHAIELWDTKSGARLGVFDLREREDEARAIAFHPDGTLFVATSLGLILHIAIE